jgi:hypothetical protein
MCLRNENVEQVESEQNERFGSTILAQFFEHATAVLVWLSARDDSHHFTRHVGLCTLFCFLLRSLRSHL